MPPKPKRKVYTIPEERLDRFELFLATLTEPEQKQLLRTVSFIQIVLRHHGAEGFSPKDTREFLMALVDFWDKHAIPNQQEDGNALRKLQ